MIKDVAKKVISKAIYSEPIAKESTYVFDNRKLDSQKLLYILAGYKEKVWNKVFNRVKKFVPKDIDVCIVSSGVISTELRDISRKNGWSYLGLKRNNISQAQNTVISIFKSAKYIIKMDEDIFITKNSIQTLIGDFCKIQKSSKYKVKAIAPLININGLTYIDVLRRFNALNDYERRFGKAYVGGQFKLRQYEKIETSADVAGYMWGEDGTLPTIDKMNELLQNDGNTKDNNLNYFLACARFSIGLIMITRDFWETMGKYKVRRFLSDFAIDEEQINSNAMLLSHPIIIDKKVIVGHLGFGGQTDAMLELYDKRNDLF